MTNLFFRNRRLLALSILLIVVAGLAGYRSLPRLEDPELTPRFARITTRLPGAKAERVETLVTEKLEEELYEIEELKVLQSESIAGLSTIIMELKDDVYEVDEVWSRVRDKLDDAMAVLPRGVIEPEFEEQEVRAYTMIAALTWEQTGEPNYAILRRLAEELDDELRAVSGTEVVDMFGDPDEEITVEISAAELAARGLSAAEVSRQIAASDAKNAAGQLRTARGDLLIEVEDQLDSLARVRRVPIRFSDGGQSVQLGDIARVQKDVVRPQVDLALIDGKPAVAVGTLIDSNRRIDWWAENARRAVENFRERLPRGVGLTVVFDQSRYTTERLENLMGNLLAGGLAVIVVIGLIMGWPSAIVVGAALPLSALMVLSGMNLLGVPMHQMSISGLIIALGLLIDNAIVMVDEVRGRLRAKLPTAEAVSRSVRHLAVPLLGSTVTTALAFMPIALMPGGAGEFVGAIAISVILAIGSSLFLAMTVIPAVAGLLDRFGSENRKDNLWNSGFSSEKMTGLYRRTLDRLFARPVLGIVLGVLLPVFGFVQATRLDEQFFPPADRDMFHIELELPAQASIAQTRATVIEARELILQDENIQNVHWFLGQSAPQFYYNIVKTRERASQYAQAVVRMKSAEGWRETIHGLQDRLDEAFPQARVLVRQLEQGPPFDAPIEVRVYGPDVARLRSLGDELRGHLASTPDVIHTRALLAEARPKLGLYIDEEKARMAGLDNTEIARQLDSTLEGATGGSILEATEELPVRVRFVDEGRGDLNRIASIDLVSSARDAANGERHYVPLAAVGHLELVPELANISRRGGRRANTVQGYISAGVLSSKVLGEFQKELAASGFMLPPGYSLEYGGESAERDHAIGNLMSSVGVLLVMMAATLVLSFGSFRLAGIIAAVGGLSVGLGLAALSVFGFPFGFMAIIGTMGMVGVAINDSIVVLAAVREDERASAGDVRAIREVVVHSTRHVLATTVTTIAGFLPLLIAGGGFWPPLVIAIAGGVAGSTLLALYFVPAAFLVVKGHGFLHVSTVETEHQEVIIDADESSERLVIATPESADPSPRLSENLVPALAVVRS